MDGRMQKVKTPWGRIAVAVGSHAVRIRNAFRKTGHGPEFPDFADLGEMLEPYVKRECILYCIERNRQKSGEALTKIVEELAQELEEIQRSLPPEDRL